MERKVTIINVQWQSSLDEIDALAKRRDPGIGLSSSLGGCNEREQTLNQLLTEMDGFASGSPSSGGVNIIVRR